MNRKIILIFLMIISPFFGLIAMYILEIESFIIYGFLFGILEFLICLAALIILNKEKKIILESLAYCFFSFIILYPLTIMLVTKVFLLKSNIERDDFSSLALAVYDKIDKYSSAILWIYIILTIITTITISIIRINKLDLIEENSTTANTRS